MKSVETYLHDIQDELCDKIVHHWEDDQRFANQREMQQYNGGGAEAMEIIRNVLDGREFKSPLLQSMKECRAAVEMQTAIPRELIEGKYFCPKCHNLMPYPGYCGCSQKVY